MGSRPFEATASPAASSRPPSRSVAAGGSPPLATRLLGSVTRVGEHSGGSRNDSDAVFAYRRHGFVVSFDAAGVPIIDDGLLLIVGVAVPSHLLPARACALGAGRLLVAVVPGLAQLLSRTGKHQGRQALAECLCKLGWSGDYANYGPTRELGKKASISNT